MVGRAASIVALALTLTACREDPPRPIAATVSGIARAVDGDTIAFGQVRIRLQGIAAPELDEPGGMAARDAMRSMIDGQTLRCDLDGTTGAGRPVGICYLQDRDIGREMVAQGLARDCPHYSAGRYQDSETAAQNAGRHLSETYALPDYCTG